MSKLTRLDVLIVYNGKIARSVTDSPSAELVPFKIGSRHETCNTAYSYFLEMCHKLHLKAAFSTSKDIISAGTCRSFWTFNHNKWHKSNSACYSTLIFDKFSPTSKSGTASRELLFSSNKVKPYNNPSLFKLFFDKQKTYDALSTHSIPTITLGSNSARNIKKSCEILAKILKTHPGSCDFTNDIIMKDRFGAGGNRVYKFRADQSKEMSATMQDNADTSFIIQPFAKFDQGFTIKKSKVSSDIRLIFLGDKIVDSYVRSACSGDFRCNQHQGGTLTYLSIDEIPAKVLIQSNIIVSILNKKNSLYSLDFIMSNNGNPYLLEGNTGPGLDWNTSVEIENVNARKFIRTIIDHLALRARTQ